MADIKIELRKSATGEDYYEIWSGSLHIASLYLMRGLLKLFVFKQFMPFPRDAVYIEEPPVGSDIPVEIRIGFSFG